MEFEALEMASSLTTLSAPLSPWSGFLDTRSASRARRLTGSMIVSVLEDVFDLTAHTSVRPPEIIVLKNDVPDEIFLSRSMPAVASRGSRNSSEIVLNENSSTYG